MAKRVATNSKLWVAEYAFSAQLQSIEPSMTAPSKPDTCFGATGYETELPGIPSGELGISGLLEFDTNVDPEDAIEAGLLGVRDKVVTLGLYGGTAGDMAYLMRAHQLAYKSGVVVGEVVPFSAQFKVQEKWILGRVLGEHTITTAGTTYGTPVQWGAVGASITYYGHLHVIYHDCTSVVVKIQSASDEAFTLPADRITFDTATGETSERDSATGAVTDTWWRTAVTVSGGNGDATVAVAVGK